MGIEMDRGVPTDTYKCPECTDHRFVIITLKDGSNRARFCRSCNVAGEASQWLEVFDTPRGKRDFDEACKKDPEHMRNVKAKMAEIAERRFNEKKRAPRANFTSPSG